MLNLANGDMRDLGPLLGVYRGGARWAMYGVGGGALVVMGLVTALTGVMDHAASGPIAGMVTQLAPKGSSETVMILVGLVIAAGGAFYLWRFIVAAGLRVAVYEKGFSVGRRGATLVASWSDVVTVRHAIHQMRLVGVTLSRSHDYALTLANGEQVTLDATIGRIGELGGLIEQRVAEVMTPAALATIHAGGEVMFGRWSLNETGISNGATRLPWSEVEGVFTSDKVINITQRDRFAPWGWALLAATPNVATLILVVEALRAEAAG